jgi:hypothetical protein
MPPLSFFFPGCAPSSEGNHHVAFPFKPSRRSFTFDRLRVTAAAVPPSLSELHPCRLFLLGWTSPHPPPSAPVPQDSPKPPLRAATTPERHCSSLPSPPHWCHTARVSPSLCHHARQVTLALWVLNLLTLPSGSRRWAGTDRATTGAWCPVTARAVVLAWAVLASGPSQPCWASGRRRVIFISCSEYLLGFNLCSCSK